MTEQEEVESTMKHMNNGKAIALFQITGTTLSASNIQIYSVRCYWKVSHQLIDN